MEILDIIEIAHAVVPLRTKVQTIKHPQYYRAVSVALNGCGMILKWNNPVNIGLDIRLIAICRVKCIGFK